MSAPQNDTITLYKAWASLRINQPKLNFFQQLTQLNASAGQLLISALNKESYLIENWQLVLPAVAKLNQVIAITSNPSCLAASAGVYQKLTLATRAQTGMVLSSAIDLRFTFKHWLYAFALVDKFNQQQSLEFVDAYGNLVHRIVLLDNICLLDWLTSQRLIINSADSSAINFAKHPAAPTELADSQIAVPALQKMWAQLHDVHHFYKLLGQFKVSRLQALRLVGARWASQLAVTKLLDLLRSASQQQIKLMIFVLNPGCMHIYSGEIRNVIQPASNKLTILDANFNLQVALDSIASVWLVRKPNKGDYVTCWEVFDHQQQLVWQIYGQRPNNTAENPVWRQLANSFGREGVHNSVSTLRD